MLRTTYSCPLPALARKQPNTANMTALLPYTPVAGTAAAGTAAVVATTGSTLFSPRGGAFPSHNTNTNKPVPPAPVGKKVGDLWYSLPSPIRFFFSGNLGTVCFYFLERGIREWMETALLQPPSQIDSISFFSAYVLHIVVQHAFHALLVYGLESVNTTQKYLQTLYGTYQAYITSAIGSTLLNTFLLKLGVNRTVAFMATLWIFACINYLWISYVVRKAVEQGGNANLSSRTTTAPTRTSKKAKAAAAAAKSPARTPRRRLLQQMRGGHLLDPVAGWLSETMPVSSFAAP